MIEEEVVRLGVTFCAIAIVGEMAPLPKILPVPELEEPTLQNDAVAVLVLVHCGNVIAATGEADAGPEPDTTNPVVERVTAVLAYAVTASSLVCWFPLDGSAVCSDDHRAVDGLDAALSATLAMAFAHSHRFKRSDSKVEPSGMLILRLNKSKFAHGAIPIAGSDPNL